MILPRCLHHERDQPPPRSASRPEPGECLRLALVGRVAPQAGALGTGPVVALPPDPQAVFPMAGLAAATVRVPGDRAAVRGLLGGGQNAVESCAGGSGLP